MAIVTAMATSFKSELLSAGHCFNATINPTFSVGSGSASVTGVSSMAGVSVGMAFTSASGIPAGTVVAAITSGTALTLSANATAALTAQAATITGDVFKMALIKPSPAGTYDSNSTNYANITASTDEVTNAAGTAYTATGQAMTNTSPTTTGTVAYVNFSNPSWTTASFSTSGCMIYNSSSRISTGRTCSVHDFGGPQTVNSGTFTVLMPTFRLGKCYIAHSVD